MEGGILLHFNRLNRFILKKDSGHPPYAKRNLQHQKKDKNVKILIRNTDANFSLLNP